MRVVIIGAGIMGASLAYALGRSGCQVTVVDGNGVATGATGRTFGWINASFYADAAHFALRAQGIEAYRRLCRDLDLPVAWSGCLCWEEEGAALQKQTEELVALGYEAEIVSATDLAWMEPAVSGPKEAVFFRSEAAVEATSFTNALLAASGAQVLLGCAVTALAETAGQISGVQIDGGLLPADRVIVAAGIGSAKLLAPFDVSLPMLQRPGVIFQTAPMRPVLNHVCVAPIGEFRQRADGCIIMPTAVAHQADTSEQLADRLDVLATDACARLQALLPKVDLRWAQVAMAQRPVPGDGLPVIGSCGPEGLFVAVMHSGITLAPVVAEILAADVQGTQKTAQAGLVAPYRIDRFQSAAS